MIRVFADQDMRDGPFGRQAALDQGGGGRCLRHAIRAGAAGVFGADSDDHAQLRRHDVQPVGAVLADLVHLPAAAWADEAVGFDDPLDPGQVLGQVAAVAPGHPFAFRRGIAGRLILFLFLGLGDCNVEVLERQLPVVLVELLGLLAMHHMVQFGHQVFETLDDLLQADRLVQQRGDCIALVLGDGRKVDIRQGRHAPNRLEMRANSPARVTPPQPAGAPPAPSPGASPDQQKEPQIAPGSAS